MSEEPNVKLPRGQSSLRSRLLRALGEGFTAPAGQRQPVYRLRDGKPIRKHSAVRIDQQLAGWEKNGHGKPPVILEPPMPDAELTAISLMLRLDVEARKRVLSYVESRS